MTLDGVDGVAFAVWAPNAQRVSVVGDFNHWDGRRHPMRKRIEVGVWEIFIPGVARGARYKFELLGPDGGLAAAEGRPGRLPPRAAAGDRVASSPALPQHEWGDGDWMETRRETQALDRADLDLRGASRLVAAQGRRPSSSPMTSSATR